MCATLFNMSHKFSSTGKTFHPLLQGPFPWHCSLVASLILQGCVEKKGI